MYKALLAVLSLCTLCATSQAGEPDMKVGTPVSKQELAKFFAIQPDGAGLPPGEGTAAAGREIYAQKCAHCHGEKLEGIKEMGGPALIGGRGSLTSKNPLKTVESYWPYATTLYDYIWRAMPFDQPGSLTADEVYALSAYILSAGKIIDENEVMNSKSLPKVVMPNAKGFYVSSGHDLEIYRAKELEEPSK